MQCYYLIWRLYYDIIGTISNYFIGYLKKSKWYRFYCSTHSTRIIEIDNDRFIENGEISESDKSQNMIIQEDIVQISLLITSNEIILTVVEQFDNDGQ